MALHIQSVNLLSKLASALGHRGGGGGREEGGSRGWGSPWLPSPRTEKWKQVCLCVNTAMMLLETQQAAITLLGS